MSVCEFCGELLTGKRTVSCGAEWCRISYQLKYRLKRTRKALTAARSAARLARNQRRAAQEAAISTNGIEGASREG